MIFLVLVLNLKTFSLKTNTKTKPFKNEVECTRDPGHNDNMAAFAYNIRPLTNILRIYYFSFGDIIVNFVLFIIIV